MDVVADPSSDDDDLSAPEDGGTMAVEGNAGRADSSPGPETGSQKGAGRNTDELEAQEGDEPDHDAGQRVGERLAGRYMLTEFIDRGAMGDVYKAEHALMKKTVAVKILNAEISGQGKIVERFRREAQAAANIDHANVCVATDFGETDEGDFFLVMEFLEGE
ncbi:MAG: protein kinase, partial [Bradymonadaceae bacterium]